MMKQYSRSLKAYISTDPVFSLDEGKYSEVQEVTLSASENRFIIQQMEVIQLRQAQNIRNRSF